nr:hypothetical protein Iba_chr12bCG14490 [Ipomoea batatas]
MYATNLSGDQIWPPSLLLIRWSDGRVAVAVVERRCEIRSGGIAELSRSSGLCSSSMERWRSKAHRKSYCRSEGRTAAADSSPKKLEA